VAAVTNPNQLKVLLSLPNNVFAVLNFSLATIALQASEPQVTILLRFNTQHLPLFLSLY